MILLIACLLYVNCLYESQQVVYKMNDVVEIVMRCFTKILSLLIMFTKWKGCWDC